jgi:hypothetical protein
MKATIILLMITLLMVGCATIIPTEEAPVILNAVTDISVGMDDSITITLEHVDVTDVNGDLMILFVLDGENYTVHNNVVVPDVGFAGDLFVNIIVQDVTGKSSKEETIIISVLPGIEEIQPLFIGAKWAYSDSFFVLGVDSVRTSQLEVTELYGETVEGITGEIYSMKWLNLDTLGLSFLFHSTDTGLIQIGGFSSKDTLIGSQMALKYPLGVDDTWTYNSVEYSINAQKFFFDTTVTAMSCIAVDEYVTVPAGTFKCVVYSFSYPYVLEGTPVATRGIKQLSGEVIPVRGMRSGTNIVTEELYYATGIGYVQNKTFLNDRIVAKKVLTSYVVEEKL